MKCVCGHEKRQHIYEEGACRPGFRCKEACRRFRPVAPKRAGQKALVAEVEKFNPEFVEYLRDRGLLD